MTKQIIFRDLESRDVHGGIMLSDGNVICGCCGGLFEADEQGETWELLDEFHDWINLDEEICGDMLYEFGEERNDEDLRNLLG